MLTLWGRRRVQAGLVSCRPMSDPYAYYTLEGDRLLGFTSEERHRLAWLAERLELWRTLIRRASTQR